IGICLRLPPRAAWRAVHLTPIIGGQMVISSLSRAARLALVLAVVAIAGTAAIAAAAPSGRAPVPKPTVVLVHGAFADSASWDAVARGLRHQGYPVLVVANPLRGLASDTAYVKSVVASINGPVVLVGHSYAGMITSQVA